MKGHYSIDPAEKWLAKQVLEPSEYCAFLEAKEQDTIRSEIKKRIFNEIRTFISRSGQNSPPIDPQRIMGNRRIKEIVWNRNLKYRESLLLPVDDGFLIQTNPDVFNTRKRFNIAHEIGHTYFFDLNVSPPQKFYPISSSRSWVEEGYACEIAREILMPEPHLSAISSKLGTGPSLQTLEQLKNCFDASYEVVLKRLLHDAHSWNSSYWNDNLWDAIVITAEPTASSETDNLRIKVYRSPKFKWMLRDAMKNEQVIHLVRNTLESNNQIHKSIEVGKKKRVYNVQGKICRQHPRMAIIIITQ
jgi:Zn-dependent peptidase ImmA (M78 family)